MYSSSLRHGTKDNPTSPTKTTTEQQKPTSRFSTVLQDKSRNPNEAHPAEKCHQNCCLRALRSCARLVLSSLFSGGHPVKPPRVVECHRPKNTCGENLFSAQTHTGERTEDKMLLPPKIRTGRLDRASTLDPWWELGTLQQFWILLRKLV